MSGLMSLVGILGLLEIKMVPEQYPADQYADSQEAIEKLQLLVPLARENTTENCDKKAQLGSLYLGTGSYAEAIPLLTETLDARRDLLGLDHPATIRTQELLACALYAHGKPTDALEQYEAAGAIRTQSPNTEDSLTVQNLFNSGVVTWYIGKHQEACDIVNKAYKMSERVHGPHHTETLSAMENLSFMYHFAERSWEAQKVQQQVVNVRLHDLPRDESSLLKSVILLGKISMDMEWWEDCEKTYGLIVELRTQLQGADSQATLASKVNLVTAVQRQGRLEEAEKICLEIAEVAQAKLGSESAFTMRNRLQLARILNDKRQHMEALAMLQEILDAQEALFGTSDEDTCSTLSDLCDTLIMLEKYDEAVAASKKLVSALNERLGEGDPEVLSARIDLSMLFARIELIDEAEDTALDVMDDFERDQEGDEVLSKLKEVVNVLLQHGRTAAFNKFYFGL